jgi:hypothetical protein
MLVGSMLVGCSTIRYGGAPEPSFDIDKDLDELSREFAPSVSIETFFKNPSKEARDKFITGRVTLANIQYIKFVRQLTSERQLLDSAASMLTLGLNLAGTAVSAAGTKTILSAIAASVTGSKEVVDKNYYFEKTIPVLVGQMNAERKRALVPILEGMKNDLSMYPFGDAVNDTHNYYQAGTFTGALQRIQADAGAKEKKADDDLDNLRKSTFGEDKAAKRIIKWIWPDGLPPKGKENTANVEALRKWMDKEEIGLSGLPIQKLLDNPKLNEFRERAIKDLNIPPINP